MQTPRSRSNRAPMRFAWLGRVSTDDLQDPTLSLPRQLHNSTAALPEGAVIVANFFDIESGRKDLALRGKSLAHEKFDIPIRRDGGIADMLAEATRSDRRFDAVICESIERIARRAYYGIKVEHELEQVGVALCAADEPINFGGKRAAQILTRRMKQGVAEWYVTELVEKSWDGLCEHTRQGWNIGTPPYGYLAEKIAHPVPAKRAEGKTKTRLLPDAVRAGIVEQIYRWRGIEHLSYVAIADRLNADLVTYPPPTCNAPSRERGEWSRFSVREILSNPKYTGYMVFNRRTYKTGVRRTDRDEWVWSPEPTHPAIISRELYEAAQAVGAERERSRAKAGMNSHPQTKRCYPLRSFIFCESCGRRMAGIPSRTNIGSRYVCRPDKSAGKGTAAAMGHPPTIYVREDALLDGLSNFFAERIFGPSRETLLAADFPKIKAQGESEAFRRMASMQRRLGELNSAQDRLVASLERQDLDAAFVLKIQDRFRGLEDERGVIAGELKALEREAAVNEHSPEVLQSIPQTVLPAFADVPEPLLRALFESFRLEVRYDKAANRARCRVTITDDTAEAIRSSIDTMEAGAHLTNVKVEASARGKHLKGAPGGIRTLSSFLVGDLC
jgi:site-specific DNA recombinase